ncbi:unnamed protein product [Anisakis simplex]|uniref:Uncharacterized protein n=1 Tax=Anisakis simplex TaxID=6269 RepID=A0A0M3K0R1_ANISI|nr:unnamed protein product [Anisakis simplex]
MPAEVYGRGLYLGETIQEKTRSLLGWNNEHCPSVIGAESQYLFSQNVQSPPAQQYKNSTNRRHHPYKKANNRVRKNSCSSSSSSASTCSDYSQPSPSYSVRSYPDTSYSPEPIAYSNATESLLTFTPYNPAFRSAEREARVFERLRQLVPVLPSDRNAYQVEFSSSTDYFLKSFNYSFKWLNESIIDILIDTVSQVMDLEQQLEQLNEQTEDVKNSLRLEGNYSKYGDDEVRFIIDCICFENIERSLCST